MRLFLCWWRGFWTSVGRTPPRYRGRRRLLSFEAAYPPKSTWKVARDVLKDTPFTAP
jgi:hypothetical protein